MKSKIISGELPKVPKCKKGMLCQGDLHGDAIVVLCLKNESNNLVSAMVLRNMIETPFKKQPGTVVEWATARLVPFNGKIELSN